MTTYARTTVYRRDYPDNTAILQLDSGIKVIEHFAFAYNDVLEQVTVPEGVESIDADAFKKCRNLRSVRLPASLRYIGEEAFADTAIEEIQLPSGLEEIGAHAFMGCTCLKAFHVPTSVRKLGRRVLFNGSSHTAVSLPDHLRKRNLTPAQQLGLTDSRGLLIEDSRLVQCRAEKEIHIPEGVREIGAEAFTASEIKGIKVHALPESLQLIRKNNLFAGGAHADALPENYFTHPVLLPAVPNLSLLKARLRMPGTHVHTAAAVYLIQNEDFVWEVLPDIISSPQSAGEEMLSYLRDKAFSSRSSCRLRAVQFYFQHRSQLPADFGQRLAALFPKCGGETAADWEEALFDVILREAGINPDTACFANIRMAENGKNAARRQVKAALVPYLAQAFWIGLENAPAAARRMPAADEAAAALDRQSFAAALPQLLPRWRTVPEQAFAFLRYAPSDVIERFTGMLKESCRSFGRRKRRKTCWYEGVCVYMKSGILLNDAPAAMEFSAINTCGCIVRSKKAMLGPYLERQGSAGTFVPILYPSHFRLTPAGTRLFDAADASGRLELCAGPDGITYRNPATQRITKGIPKYMYSIKREIQTAAKQIENYRVSVSSWLQELIDGMALDGEDISLSLLMRITADSLLRREFTGIVWRQNTTFFRICMDGRLTDADGMRPVLDRSAVYAASPSDMSEDLLDKWRHEDRIHSHLRLPEQLAGPRYEPPAVSLRRFQGCSVALQDLWRVSGEDGHGRHAAGIPLGLYGTLPFLRRSDNKCTLGEILLMPKASIDTAAHQRLFALDRLTFDERLTKGDSSLLSFLAGVEKPVFQEYMQKVMQSAEPGFTAAALEIAHQREEGAALPDITLDF